MDRFSNARAIVYACAIILFVASQLSGWEGMTGILSVLSILAIGLSLPFSGRVTKWLSLILLGVGTVLVVQRGIGLADYILAYGEMLYLLSLFTLVPLLAIPIRIGGYQPAFHQLFTGHVQSISQLYRILTALSYFLGSFLNMATLPIVHASVKETVAAYPLTNVKRFLAGGIIQGYSLPIIWTPLSGVVGVALYVTHVSWLRMFPSLLAISILALVFNWVLFRCLHPEEAGKKETAAALEHQDQAIDSTYSRKKLREISMAIVILLTGIVWLDHVLGIGLVMVVSVMALPYAWAWACFLRRSRDFWRECRQHFTRTVPAMSDSFAIFLSAGFFVEALHLSGHDITINHWFLQLGESLGTELFLILLPLFTLLLSFLGLHPIVVINLLAESLNPELLSLSPEEIAMALLGGAVLTFYLGPFSGTLGLMSSIVKEAPLRIAGWNFIYAMGFFIVLALGLWIF